MAGETAAVSMTVNGKPITANVDPRTLLVQLLRDNLRLTGTHVGCDTSQCGACTVEIDGRATKSCTMLAVMADGAVITPSMVVITAPSGSDLGKWLRRGRAGAAIVRPDRTVMQAGRSADGVCTAVPPFQVTSGAR